MASLKYLINERKISVYKLSKDTGIPYSTICDLVAESTPMENTSAGTLLRLATYFNVSMESMLSAGYDSIIYIFNNGRDVHINYLQHNLQYLGPKNLISFKRINRVVGGTIYIETYFSNEEGDIYSEEDYIDLEDIFNDYGIDVPVDIFSSVKLGNPGCDNKLRIIDESLMVSDSMAICLAESSTEDITLEIVNINRINNRMILRLKDYMILSTNMSKNMQSRAIKSVKRNEELIITEITEKDYAHA